MDWHQHLIETPQGIAKVLSQMQRVAVLGIKTRVQADQAAYYVPEYLSHAGLEVIPVPVYYPDATEILGQPVYRRVRDVPGRIDVVDVFRRPVDLPAHLEDLIAAKPRAVWLQLGIHHDAFAEGLARADIDVVQSRCLMVDHREWARSRGQL